MYWESGDQNGYVAPSVRSSLCAKRESSARTQIVRSRPASSATKATYRPLGDTANICAALRVAVSTVPSGGGIVKRVIGAAAGPGRDQIQTTAASATDTAIPATVHCIHLGACC